MQQEAFRVHPRGWYIVFEGGDGCGKSTQLERVYKFLAGLGKIEDIIKTKEPGERRYWGRRIYRDLRQGDFHKKYPFGFQEWYARDFEEEMSSVTVPALNTGKIVLKDRSHVVSCVYGSEDERDVDKHLQRAFMADDKESLVGSREHFFWPDAIFIFDVSFKTARERLLRKGRKLDGHENEKVLIRVQEMYRWYAEIYPNCYLIDADRKEEEVFTSVERILTDVFRDPSNKEETGFSYLSL